MPAGQELFEDLREQGRHEGELRGELRRARQAVLEGFEAHLDVVPDTVRSAVTDATDLGPLSGWLRAVARVRDADSAAHVILESR